MAWKGSRTGRATAFTIAVAVATVLGTAGPALGAENVHDGLADPNTVNSGEKVKHTFSYVVNNVSNDGSSDKLYLEFPNEITSANLSSFSGNVQDEDTGASVSIASSSSIVDGLDGDGVQDSVKIGVQPEGEKATLDLRVNFTGYVTWPTVDSTTDFPLEGGVTDSGRANVKPAVQFATVTVQAPDDGGGSTDTSPSVSTDPASGIGETSATLNGEVTSLGGASRVDAWFVYWQDGAKSSTKTTTAKQTLSSTGSFSADVSGLDPGTSYVFEAHVDASDGDQATGSTSTFTTDTSTTSSAQQVWTFWGQRAVSDADCRFVRCSTMAETGSLTGSSVRVDGGQRVLWVADEDAREAIDFGTARFTVRLHCVEQATGDLTVRLAKVDAYDGSGFETLASNATTTEACAGEDSDLEIGLTPDAAAQLDAGQHLAVQIQAGSYASVDVYAKGDAPDTQLAYPYESPDYPGTDTATTSSGGSTDGSTDGSGGSTDTSGGSTDGTTSGGSAGSASLPEGPVFTLGGTPIAAEACPVDACWSMAIDEAGLGGATPTVHDDRALAWTAQAAARERFEASANWTLRLHCTEKTRGLVTVSFGTVDAGATDRFHAADSGGFDTGRCEGEDSDVLVPIDTPDGFAVPVDHRPAVVVRPSGDAALTVHAKPDAPDTQLLAPASLAGYPGTASTSDASNTTGAQEDGGSDGGPGSTADAPLALWSVPVALAVAGLAVYRYRR